MLDKNGVIIPDKTKRPAHFSAQAKRSHVNAFESSRKTMTAYCEAHNIPLSTFSAWVTKYSKKQQAAFVPIAVQNNPPSQAASKKQTSTQYIEIHRGDLKVLLPVSNDVRMVTEIIKGMLACS